MPGRSFLVCVASTQFTNVHSFLYDIPVNIANHYGYNGQHYLSAASDGQSASLVAPDSLARGKWKIKQVGGDLVRIENYKASDGGRTMLSSKTDGNTDVWLQAPVGGKIEEKWHLTMEGANSFNLRSDTNWPHLNENDPDEDESDQDGIEDNELDNHARTALGSGVEGHRRRRRRTEGHSYLSVPNGQTRLNLDDPSSSDTANEHWQVEPAGCQVLVGLWNPSDVRAQWDGVRELIAKETQGVQHGTDIHLSADVHLDWSESVKISIKAGIHVGPFGGAQAKASFHQSLDVSGHFEAEVNYTTLTSLTREFRESDIGSYIWQWNVYTKDSCGNSRTTQTQQLQLTPGSYQPPCCLPGYHDHDDKLACRKNQFGEDTLYPGGERFGCKVWQPPSPSPSPSDDCQQKPGESGRRRRCPNSSQGDFGAVEDEEVVV